MAQSQTELYNLAIASVGADYTISSPTEESVPAEVCELYYDNVRQTVLRSAFWHVAKRHERLTKDAARDAESGYDSDPAAEWVPGDPEPGYAFSYQLPTDMLRARYLTTHEMFSMGWNEDDDRAMLSCNTGGGNAEDPPILCYTTDVTDVALWDPGLYQAVAYGLGAHICLPLTGKASKADTLFTLANSFILTARADAANEMGHLRNTRQAPERLQARGYLYYPVITPYIYPYGHLLTGTGAGVV